MSKYEFNTRAFAFRILVVGLVAGAIIGFWRFFSEKSEEKDVIRELPRSEYKNYAIEDITLGEAGKIGEKKTLRLLVQIYYSNGENGQQQRGDVVLIAPLEHEFSPAEKEGFLIIRMEMTAKQAEILTKPDFRYLVNKDGHLTQEVKKSRIYAIDLKKIGIDDNDTKGREIKDKVFQQDAFFER